MPTPVIFGCQGLSLTEEEEQFFADSDPYGFILFARNIASPEQVSQLTGALREVVQREDAPILVDQEGGRVRRLKPPHWSDYPPAQHFTTIMEQEGLAAAQEALRDNTTRMAHELLAAGFTVDCAPVADLLIPECHDIVGDRAFGADVDTVVALAGVVIDTFLAHDITPVIKHIPGHGRALCDSHEDLPVVNTDLDTLNATDFAVFRQLTRCPWAMTAHIIYHALDPELPATLSPKVIRYIREEIAYKGLLLTDDLSMKALQGSFTERAQQSLEAGCDIVLHCNGEMREMQEVLEGCLRYLRSR